MKTILTQTLKKAQTLDEFLDSYHFSKKQKHLLKMEKRIKVNGQITTHSTQLKIHDLIEIDCLKDEPINISPVVQPLEILYEDEVVLVVNKPIHMIVHSDGTETCTVDHLVAGYYQKTKQSHPVYHVHRLDKDTSGCLLYCKQSYLLPYFDYCLKEKAIKRTYLALVHGKIDHFLTINAPIGKDRHVSNKYRVAKNGQSACTHITPIKTFQNKTLVECQLETGRTHQIRVHLSSIGHYLIGDELYGKKAFCRCALHSHTLTFIHPLTHQKIQVSCALPDDIQKWMR